MNDTINNIAKFENITKPFKIFLKIVKNLYNTVVLNNVRNRRNRDKSKMVNLEIIIIYLLIKCLGKSINKRYNFLKKSFLILMLTLFEWLTQ